MAGMRQRMQVEVAADQTRGVDRRGDLERDFDAAASRNFDGLAIECPLDASARKHLALTSRQDQFSDAIECVTDVLANGVAFIEGSAQRHQIHVWFENGDSTGDQPIWSIDSIEENAGLGRDGIAGILALGDGGRAK